MSRVNLATVFGPVLLSGSLMENPSQEKFRNVPFEIRLVEEMMTYYQWLFDVSVYYLLTLGCHAVSVYYLHFYDISVDEVQFPAKAAVFS